MPRTEAEAAITRLGGTIATGVSKKLSHLIVGEDAGSKLAKAQKAGVPIHDEQWLIDLLKSEDISPGLALPDPLNVVTDQISTN
jgi:DNA ligase (NAD+)